MGQFGAGRQFGSVPPSSPSVPGACGDPADDTNIQWFYDNFKNSALTYYRTNSTYGVAHDGYNNCIEVGTGAGGTIGNNAWLLDMYFLQDPGWAPAVETVKLITYIHGANIIGDATVRAFTWGFATAAGQMWDGGGITDFAGFTKGTGANCAATVFARSKGVIGASVSADLAASLLPGWNKLEVRMTGGNVEWYLNDILVHSRAYMPVWPRTYPVMVVRKCQAGAGVFFKGLCFRRF